MVGLSIASAAACGSESPDRADPGTETETPADVAPGTVSAQHRTEGQRIGSLFGSGDAYGHGSLWIVAEIAGELDRIDPGTGERSASIPIASPGDSSDVMSVTVDERSVWVAHAAEQTLTQVDPETDAVLATHALTIEPSSVVSTGDVVWMTGMDREADFAEVVVRVDPGSGRELSRTELGSGSRTVARAAGSVWVVRESELVELGDDGAVTRRLALPLVAFGALVEADGVLWVRGEPVPGEAQDADAGASAEAALQRVDPGSGDVEVVELATDGTLLDLAAIDGVVYATLTQGPLVSVDAATRRVEALELLDGDGFEPADLVAADRALWAVDVMSRRYARIEPRG